MAEELVTVATFSTPHEASLAKADLEACGIPAFTADEFTIGVNPLYSNALGGIKVRVPASFLAEAQAVLAGTQQPSDKSPGDAAPVAAGYKRKRKTWAKYFVWLWLLLAAAATVISLFTNR